MGNLRDQLKKANLISKKDAKRLAHEERVHRKEAGREGLEREEAERKQAIEQKRAAERERDRERQKQLDAERKQHEEYAACEEILRTHLRPPQRGGSIRWFFELDSGHLPSIVLQQGDLAQLSSGGLCVARLAGADTHAYGLLATEHARRVHRILPDRIVWSAPGALPAN